ncbi:MAG: FIST C-terminal domain-containing protein [Myxococcales bacterium]|nr:FIST C-terminal domain-containing protein [Myxococcales bacterium]
MQLEQRIWTPKDGWGEPRGELSEPAELLLLFGGTSVLAEQAWRSELSERHPNARLFGCSTAGEICDTRVYDDSLSVTAVRFEGTTMQTAYVRLDDHGGSSTETGVALAEALPAQGLRHVFTLSDGQGVNGSELVRGLYSRLPEGVQVTGGLAGDGARFERTLVFADDAPREGVVAALGLYGDALRIGYGSLGGWDPFGPKRTITKSSGNVLFELDGKPALELYKRYLGEHATGLPATGLLFPLNIQRPAETRTVVRTILAVDEAEQSLTFAGDVPEGSVAQLMKANFERLIDGAADAAKACVDPLGTSPSPELAVLISCVGRKLVLKQRTEEEVEGVRDVLGPSAALTGFYSYGEICPTTSDGGCELHNQTMTITTFREQSA